MTRAASYELLIFDWDGTLMDSAAHIVATATRAIESMGLPPREPRQISELIGLGLRDAFDRLFPEIDPKEMDRLLVEYSQRFAGVSQQTAELFEGVQESLEMLRKQGFTLAIATGKSRRGLDRALRESGLEDMFAISRCADESANKPHPQMLHDILLKTATEPDSALMIGDTEYDMVMAQTAQVHALAVGCGVHDVDRLRSAGALDVLDSVSELPDWLATVETG